MKMKFFVPFLLLAVALSGCSPAPVKISLSESRQITNNLSYAKDDRTGHCFAVIGSRKANEPMSGSTTITWVPCNPEVERLIGK
jgi:hypothetical protein